MEPTEAFAAYRYGKLLYGIIGYTKSEVELWIRACYLQELKLKMHKTSDVLSDHGIEIHKVEIRKVDQWTISSFNSS